METVNIQQIVDIIVNNEISQYIFEDLFILRYGRKPTSDENAEFWLKYYNTNESSYDDSNSY